MIDSQAQPPAGPWADCQPFPESEDRVEIPQGRGGHFRLLQNGTSEGWKLGWWPMQATSSSPDWGSKDSLPWDALPHCSPRTQPCGRTHSPALPSPRTVHQGLRELLENLPCFRGRIKRTEFYSPTFEKL